MPPEPRTRPGDGGERCGDCVRRNVDWSTKLFNSVRMSCPNPMMLGRQTRARQKSRFCTELIGVDAQWIEDSARSSARARTAPSVTARGRARRPSSRINSSERSKLLCAPHRRRGGAQPRRAAATAPRTREPTQSHAWPREAPAPARRGRRFCARRGGAMPTCVTSASVRTREARATALRRRREAGPRRAHEVSASRTAAQRSAGTVATGISQVQSRAA